jgi:hypothetical protein
LALCQAVADLGGVCRLRRDSVPAALAQPLHVLPPVLQSLAPKELLSKGALLQPELESPLAAAGASSEEAPVA